MVLTALVVAGLVAFTLIREQLSRELDRSLLQAWQALVEDGADDGSDGEREAVRERLAAVPDGSMPIPLQDGDGRVIAGVSEDLQAPAKWSSVVRGKTLSLRVYRAVVSGDILTMGDSPEGLHDVGEVVIGDFGRAAKAMIIVALGGGAPIAGRVQGIVGRVEGAKTRVSAGDLGARISEGRGPATLIGSGAPSMPCWPTWRRWSRGCGRCRATSPTTSVRR